MAILITIFQCDNCAGLAPVKSNADWRMFEETWWEGFHYQFCPNCRERPETRERRLSDEQMTVAFADARGERILESEILMETFGRKRRYDDEF